MFALLVHETGPAPAGGAGGVHWDFMLETPDAAGLRTWRLSANPLVERGPIVAELLGDHRREYLDFEGDIGRGRGRVRRLDRGPAELQAAGAGCTRVVLQGERLSGTFEIRVAHDGRGTFAPAGTA